MDSPLLLNTIKNDRHSKHYICKHNLVTEIQPSYEPLLFYFKQYATLNDQALRTSLHFLFTYVTVKVTVISAGIKKICKQLVVVMLIGRQESRWGPKEQGIIISVKF